MAKSNNILATPTTKTAPTDTGPKLRANAVYTVVKDFDAGTISWVFADGSLPPIVLNVTALNNETHQIALYHGLAQKGSDPAALAKGSTPADKHAAILAVVGNVQNNQWKKPAGERAQSSTLLIRAIAEMKSIPVEKATEFIGGKSSDEKKALSLHPPIAAIIARLRAESGKSADVDANALLAELA